MAIYQPKNEETFYHSRVLYDKLYNINTYKPEFKFDIKLNINEHINYVSGTSSPSANNIKMFYFTQQAAASTLIEWMATLTYYDN